MKGKLAATAATAALAVASPAAAAKPTHQRAPVGGGGARVSRLVEPQGVSARQALDVMRRDEQRRHRRELASMLAAELPRAGAGAVERGLADAETDPARIATSVARSTGASERQVTDAFEAMARNARAMRLRSPAR